MSTTSILGSREKARDRVGVEVVREDVAAPEADLFGDGVTEAHGEASFGLLAESIGIEHDAAVEREHEAIHADCAGVFVHGDLGHSGIAGVGVPSRAAMQEDEETAAGEAKEIAARELDVFHYAPSLTPAASWMAATIRMCEPQRQRLSSMPWMI
jgi:hypothetical protein